jgi:hypothetical protein
VIQGAAGQAVEGDINSVLGADRATQVAAAGQVVEGVVHSVLGSRARQGAAEQAEEGDAVLVQQSGVSQGNKDGTANDHRLSQRVSLPSSFSFCMTYKSARL